MAECSGCGAASRWGKITHATGCPFAPGVKSTAGRAPASGKGTDGKSHRHDYKTTRTEHRDVTVREGRKKVRYRYTYYFQVCRNANCPRPDNIETTRQII